MVLGTDFGTLLRIAGWILFSGVIWAVWILWWLARRRDMLYAAVAALLLGLAQIVLIELVLGWMQLLFAVPILIMHLAVLGAVAWFGAWPNRRESCEYLRAWWNGIRRMNWPAVAICLVGLFIGITVWNLFWAWFLPPRMWDSLAYHLPILASFYQAHAVYPIPSPSVWVRYYPINGELIQLFGLNVVGIDKLIDWAFVPAYFGGLLAVYGLARRLGAGRLPALLGSCVFAFAPGMLIQEADTLNDALFASLVAMGLFMIFGVPRRNATFQDLLGSSFGTAAAAGLLLGLKITGAIYVFGFAVLFILRWSLPAQDAENRLAFRPSIKNWLVVFLLTGGTIATLGAYSYIRNWITAGDPLAPFTVQIRGVVIFEGAKQVEDFVNWSPDIPATASPAYAVLYAWFEPYSTVYDQMLGGLGPLWIVLGVPACLVWGVLCFRRRRWMELCILLVMALCFLATPDYWHPRYVFSLLIIGGLAVALVWEELSWPVRWLLAGEIILLSAFSVFNTLAPFRLGADDIVAVVLRQTDQDRSSAHYVMTGDGQHAYEWLEKATRAQGATIVYGKQVTFPYALYGSNLRNLVVPVAGGSEADWGARVEQAQARYIIVMSFTPQYEWTTRLANYQEAYRDGNIVIFQHNP